MKSKRTCEQYITIHVNKFKAQTIMEINSLHKNEKSDSTRTSWIQCPQTQILQASTYTSNIFTYYHSNFQFLFCWHHFVIEIQIFICKALELLFSVPESCFWGSSEQFGHISDCEGNQRSIPCYGYKCWSWHCLSEPWSSSLAVRPSHPSVPEAGRDVTEARKKIGKAKKNHEDERVKKFLIGSCGKVNTNVGTETPASP